MTITTRIETQTLNTDREALALYGRLRTVYAENELFLLESLSGPEPDNSRSIIGFGPMLTLSVSDRMLTVEPLEAGPIAGELAALLPSAQRLEGVKGLGRLRCPVPGIGDLFDILRQLEARFDRQGDFGMGWFGYFGYDTIFMIEDLAERIDRAGALPVISLTLYRGILTLDVAGGGRTLSIIHIEADRPTLMADTMALLTGAAERRGQETGDGNPAIPQETYPYKAHDSIDRSRFADWFATAKRHIAQGDVYQLQLGHEIIVESDMPPFEVYRQLRVQDPSPYMYYFVTPQGVHVIGASPELFIGLTPQGHITLRPITGTVGNPPPGPGAQEARQAAIECLTGDPKERSEHLMLVDLGRNDVARCCTPESLVCVTVSSCA